MKIDVVEEVTWIGFTLTQTWYELRSRFRNLKSSNLFNKLSVAEEKRLW